MKAALTLNIFSRIKYFLLLVLWLVFFILGQYLPFSDGMTFKEGCENIVNNNLDVPAKGFATFVSSNWNLLEYASIGIIIFGIFMSFTCVGCIKSIEPKKGLLRFIGFIKIITGSIISGCCILFNAGYICDMNNQQMAYPNQVNYNQPQMSNQPQGYNQASSQNIPMNQNQIQNNPNRWQPTGIVPHRAYNYPRPTRSMFLLVFYTIFIIITLPTIIIPLIVILLYKGVQRKVAFKKRADKIVKRGMTYDEVIYIMEGYTPKEAYYTRNGDYVLKYMIGRKALDYEQRKFYFDFRGILVDIGVAYRRTN